MSARQRQRLQQRLKQLEAEAEADVGVAAQAAEDSEEEEESDDEEPIVTKGGFGGFADTDSSSDDGSSGSGSQSDEEEQNDEDERDKKDIHVTGVAEEEEEARKEEDQKQERERAEMALLEQAIEEAAAKRDATSPRNCDYGALFNIDGKSTLLDIDVVVSRRFGKFAAAVNGPDNNNNNNNNNRRNRGAGAGGAGRVVVASRKSVFGCKDEWPKPSAYVSGGLGQRLEAPTGTSAGGGSSSSHNKVQQRYCYEESKEWRRSGALFRIVKEFGDINRAVLFLLYCNEVHPECLLMLGSVLARYGRMDRALDMVRRALYTYECASLASFFPSTGNAGAGSGSGIACVLDWRVPENAPLFTALFRYMHLVGMQGYHTLARDVARLLLSLSPDDPMLVLLALDHYLVQCDDDDSRTLLRGVLGVTSLALGEAEDGGEGVRIVLDCSYPLLDGVDDDRDRVGKDEDASSSSSPLTVAHLGNWWMSLALTEEQAARRTAAAAASASSKEKGNVGGGEEDETTVFLELDTAEATLVAALTRFPCMLRPLVDSLEDVATSTKARLEQAMLQPPFKEEDGEEVEKTQEEAPCAGVFKRVAEIYAVRNKSLWQSRLRFLVAGAEGAVASRASTSTPSSSSSSCYHSTAVVNTIRVNAEGLAKYASASEDNYCETIAQFPQEANPLDAQFADFERLLEPTQLEHQRARLRRAATEAFPGPGGMEELITQYLLQGVQQQQHEWEGEELLDFGFGGGRVGGDEPAAAAQQEQLQQQQAEQQRAVGEAAADALEAIDNEAEAAAAAAAAAATTEGERIAEVVQPAPAVRREHLQDGTFVPPTVAAAARAEVHRLDYSAPLMQLLLQSFFLPWFRL